VHGFWPVQELANLAEGPTVCREVARGGCLLGTSHYDNANCADGLDQTFRSVSDSLLACRLKDPPAHNHALRYKNLLRNW
jgi:hypothetical protein